MSSLSKIETRCGIRSGILSIQTHPHPQEYVHMNREYLKQLEQRVWMKDLFAPLQLNRMTLNPIFRNTSSNYTISEIRIYSF